MTKQALSAIFLISILGIICYANSFDNQFVWDDENLIVDNKYIRNFSYIPHIFTSPLFNFSYDKVHIFYRPIQVFSYLIDYSIWGLKPLGYHFTNVLLHILVALSVYWLISILYDDRVLSFLTGILFVAHPIHTEAVTYMSGRAESMSALFMLLCFILYIRYYDLNRIGTYFLMLIAYALALLCKEYSIILPALLLLYHYVFKKKLKTKGFLTVLSIAFIYILLRLTVLKSFLLYMPRYTTFLFQRVPGFFVAIATYVRLLFLPFGLHMEYGKKLFSFSNPTVILGLVISLPLLIYIFTKKKSDRVIFFSICWFFITLLPISNIYPVNAYMAEHWLYFPSIGFFLILAKGLSSIYRRKTFRGFFIILMITLIVFYSYLTIRQNNYWREPLTFYKRTLQFAPDSARVYYNLGNEYNKLGNKQESVASYKKAIKHKSDYVEAYYNLAMVYGDIGEKDEAIASYEKAIEIDPTYAKAYNNLGNEYSDIGRKEEAIALYKKAIKLKPDYAEAYCNLGNVYGEIGNRNEAIISYKKSIECEPHYAKAYNNLGNINRELGNKDDAIASYKRAIEIKPDDAEVYYNLGNIYRELGSQQESVASYKKAIEHKPEYVEAYYNLGMVYGDIGEREEAINSYKKAIELSPTYAKAYNNLAVIYYYNKEYKLAVEYCDKAQELGFVNPALSGALNAYRE